jgi:predicted RNA-binding protein
VCLAKVYLKKGGDESLIQDIAYMRLHDDQVELETLLGEEKTITGKVVEVDFTTSKILLDENSKSEVSS